MNKESQEKLNKITDRLFAEYKRECEYVTEYALKLEYISEKDAETDPEKTEGRIIQYKAEIRRVLEESSKSESPQIKITDELHNKLVKSFKSRAEMQNFKGKEYLKQQAEFFAGAVCVMDLINDTKDSCITPLIYFSILRGDVISEKVIA